MCAVFSDYKFNVLSKLEQFFSKRLSCRKCHDQAIFVLFQFIPVHHGCNTVAHGKGTAGGF
jgi:hypothetical protein